MKFYHKQFVTPTQRKLVIEDIQKRLGDNTIFLAGIAYQAHCVNALEEGGWTETEALGKLRYPKDIDIFAPDSQKAACDLGTRYRWRGEKNDVVKKPDRQFIDPKTLNIPKRLRPQRRIEVGTIKLRKEMKTEYGIGVNERNVYLNVDIFNPHYYSGCFPKDKRAEALKKLESNSIFSRLSGNRIRVQGLDDLMATKLVNIERAKDNQQHNIPYDKDAADILNLIYLHPGEIYLDCISDLIGRETLLKSLKIASACISQHPDLKDHSIARIMEEQVVPQPLEVSENLLVGDRKSELEELEKVMKTIK